jgi:hypothetical protein
MHRSILCLAVVGLLVACGHTPNSYVLQQGEQPFPTEEVKILSVMDITASEITLDCYNDQNDHFAITVDRTDEVSRQDVNKLCTRIGSALPPSSSSSRHAHR